MSSDPIRRVETTHIDEVRRTATSTTQWFAEKRHATHPITHNNQLKVLFCGEEGFADIATQIESAKQSIDLVCWGFDPGMELRRGAGPTWPRGKTYGDLLIEARNRGVKVRLLVWFDRRVAGKTLNMPGHSHGTSPWRTSSGSAAADKINAKRSLDMLQADWEKPRPHIKGQKIRKITREMIPLLAREEYCYSWCDAAFHGLLPGIEVRKRSGDAGKIKRSLASEQRQPGSMSQMEIERAGLILAGTHHQKTILIDFAYEGGSRAVGYVMGLNSVTDYWDTCEHKLEDPRREQGAELTAKECVQDGEADPGFLSLKPYQDYACRIDGGKALIAVYNNFVTGWDRSIDDRMHTAANQCVARDECKAVPPALLRKAEPGNSTVQIVRTQPDEDDKSIKDIYYLATDAACLAGGYLYVENQYFQNEEWAQRLMQKRKDVVAAWKRGAAKAGKSMEDMPVMHVFIVIPVPERAQMIPTTHDTLTALGAPGGMTGQVKMIDEVNKSTRALFTRDELGIPTNNSVDLPAVVRHANEMEKRDSIQLENIFSAKVAVAMLQVSGYDKRRWRYREIYIHSKLLLVDDGFMTLGSANLNQRSMAVDSEINIATNDAALARSMRNRIWMQHSGGLINGNGGTQADIAEAFKQWKKLMHSNLARKKEGAAMVGFLLPLEDKRSSTMRLG
ncbi:phospholipase D-like domain-containing protein [Janthinobacterium sp. CG3]|uniref:phospholipase D-like domain-containing protein n=1 Tax=Janthinobacterium sp. CG3 TaxID=1075768 RepID=UPI0003488EEA|nr:phospholipase D-like domain-containing protein [Janthinobacterium sp. CG3]